MSFLPYLELPQDKGKLRRVATVVGPGVQKIHPVNLDDTNLGRHRSSSKGLAPPQASNVTGSLQDLTKIRSDSVKSGFLSGRTSPRLNRKVPALGPELNYLDYDDEAQNLIKMNIQHLLRQREPEYVSRSEFTFLVGTFNVNGQSPSNAKLGLWLSGCKGAEVPDIIAISFQELDNSNQAYLFTESAREAEWCNALARTIYDTYTGEAFSNVRVVRLVGMMLVIFVQEKLMHAMKNVDSATVGCGLLGRLGNKGGVAVRFDLHDTSLCFVASHLSAHLEECDRRNQDFREINSRMVFTKLSALNNNEPLRIEQHDLVFWAGDLNYRIVNLPNDKCKAAIEQEKYDELYSRHDQLKMEMEFGKVFQGYKEGKVLFRPTYKYDTGTSRWDSSEKARIPAWCDRILWKVNSEEMQYGDPVNQLTYQSHQDIFISDHKPVSSIFKVKVRIVDQAKYESIYKQILRDFDKNENQQRPMAEPDLREVDFGEVKFLEANTINLSLKNTGSVPLEFVFKPTPNHPHCPAPLWLTVSPARGHIPKDQSITIQLTARIDPNIVSSVALTPGRGFTDVLVLHLVCGGDTFIPVHGRLALTCFGLPLAVLNSTGTPIGLLDPSELSVIMGTPPTELPKSFPLPKEVFRLVDRLSKPDALKNKDLLRNQGTLHDKIKIRDALDLTFPGEPIPGSLVSIGDLLLDFLMSLPTPLVPVALQPACMAASTSTELSVALMENTFQKNSPKHYALFLYLMKFLSELVRHRKENRMPTYFLAGLFAALAFKNLAYSDDPVASSSRQSQLPIEARNFVLRLIGKEGGLSDEEINILCNTTDATESLA